MRKSVLVLLAGLVSTSPSFAALSVHVTADGESKVYLGSTYLGTTPIDIHGVKLGTHTLKVKNVQTGEVQTFSVVSSKVANTEKSLHADFAGGSASGASAAPRASARYRVEPYDPPQRSYAAPEYGYAPYSAYGNYAPAYSPAPYYPAPAAVPYYAAEPAYYPAPVYSSPYYGGASCYRSPYYGRDRSGVEFRNVILGAALANEVFNNGRHSRRDFRRGLVGAGLVNELVLGSSRHGRGGYRGGFFGF
ncbi:MAG: PEGA domain-containing protein [Candidatus Wallbacteria bacterium]|nr:PEGA domain-containing protein [Candidatus Wallbacteria bacterium]